ncbi:MAG TPA: hypothetical protein VGG80_04335 [Acidobacteriaceae bacterium]
MSEAAAGVVYGVMGKVWGWAMLANKTAGKPPISGHRCNVPRSYVPSWSPLSLLLCATVALGSAAVLPRSALSQATPSQATSSQTTPSQTKPSQTTASQVPPSQAPATATPAHARRHKKPTPLAVPPPPPPPTVAPSLFQEPPVPATVTAATNLLTVTADNSSLAQILHQVSSATGMKLDGLGGDERVFGSFGPGAPREVLTSLLNGTSYNVMMVGDLPNGAPRELLLTSRAVGGAPAPANANPAQPQTDGDASADDSGNSDDSSDDSAPPMQYTPPSITPAAPPPRSTPQLRNFPSPPQ